MLIQRPLAIICRICEIELGFSIQLAISSVNVLLLLVISLSLWDDQLLVFFLHAL